MKQITPAKPENELAFQHNHLIRTPLKMGLVEARIFIHALGQVHQSDKAFKPVKIPLSAIVGENEGGEDYKAVHAGCKALVRQILNVLPPDSKRGNLREVPLMAEIELDLGTGFITGTFNEKAKPYLLDLKKTKNFTTAQIEKLLTFTNPNSARLYWILLSYRNLDNPTGIVKVQIELDELKLWMLKDASKYPLYTEFKKWVLNPIEEDFKRIGFNATWVPRRTGKKTTALLFTIPKDRKPPARTQRALLQAAALSDMFDTWLTSTKDVKLITAYRGLTSEVNQLTTKTAQTIIRYVAEHPEIAPQFYAARYRIKNHKEPVKNPKTFTLKTINDALGTHFK